MTPKSLPRTFFEGDTVEIARALLGCVLWHRVGGEIVAARIVETEAYLGANDPASHARGGLRSPRNESMYLDGGHAYVYFTYGMHFCMNVVTSQEGIAEAVLLRAAEPVRGIESMFARRARAKKETDLMSGPGKLCQALGIDRRCDGVSLRSDTLFLTRRESPVDEGDIAITPRIGIDNSGIAATWPLRFLLRSSRHISTRRHLSAG